MQIILAYNIVFKFTMVGLISSLLSDVTVVVSCRLVERLVKTQEKPKLKPYPDRQELDYRYVSYQNTFHRY